MSVSSLKELYQFCDHRFADISVGQAPDYLQQYLQWAPAVPSTNSSDPGVFCLQPGFLPDTRQKGHFSSRYKISPSKYRISLEKKSGKSEGKTGYITMVLEQAPSALAEPAGGAR